MVSGANAMIVRTGEATSALLTVLAGMLALSPAAVRSPTAMRKTVDELGKRLRRQVAAAESDPELHAFRDRVLPRRRCGGQCMSRDEWSALVEQARAIDLRKLIDHYNVKLEPAWKGAKHEFVGACPRCGTGNDRFSVNF